MKVLVLGHKGMLGHMVAEYLTKQDVEVHVTVHKWPEQNFKDDLKRSKCDFVVNCIAKIPQKNKRFNINYELPIWIDKNTDLKQIYPGTFCNDTSKYCLSKAKAQSYIRELGKKVKTLRSSVIGPELKTNSSLFEWFLSNNEVKGYTDYMWMGVTTLTWAKQCYKMMLDWDNYEKDTLLESDILSKYNLLNLINDVFEHNAKITPTNNTFYQVFPNGIPTPPVREQLIELKQWMKDNYTLYYIKKS